MKRGLFYFPNLFHSEIPKSLTSQPSFKLSRRVDGDINIDQVLQDIIYFNQSTSELNFLQPVLAVSFLCCSCHDAAQSRAAAPLLSLIVVFTFSSLGRGENNNTAPPPQKVQLQVRCVVWTIERVPACPSADPQPRYQTYDAQFYSSVGAQTSVENVLETLPCCC